MSSGEIGVGGAIGANVGGLGGMNAGGDGVNSGSGGAGTTGGGSGGTAGASSGGAGGILGQSTGGSSDAGTTGDGSGGTSGVSGGGTTGVHTGPVVEPSGLIVPLDSVNGETQLYTFFASLGENIDWLADASVQPAVLSPQCGLRVTFVLNQAGNHYGLAWYNATGSAPQASELYIIVAANSPVGVISMPNLKSDPNYQGGSVGFALVGGQTHYSERQWNVVCTTCAPVAPSIVALVYPSTASPNTYYLAFEDSTVSSNSFNNDGDFNDDVFRIEITGCGGSAQN